MQRMEWYKWLYRLLRMRRLNNECTLDFHIFMRERRSIFNNNNFNLRVKLGQLLLSYISTRFSFLLDVHLNLFTKYKNRFLMQLFAFCRPGINFKTTPGHFISNRPTSYNPANLIQRCQIAATLTKHFEDPMWRHDYISISYSILFISTGFWCGMLVFKLPFCGVVWMLHAVVFLKTFQVCVLSV